MLLTIFFMALERDCMIVWETFVPEKRDPGSTTAGSHLAGMKLFPCNHMRKFKKSLQYCQDPGKARQIFIPEKRDHIITT